MSADPALFRSVLYIPGSRERAIEKSRGLECDAIIFDLEDAVAPDEKDPARQVLAEELAKGGFGSRYKLVRVNGQDTEWGADDLAAVKEMDCDAVLVPKVDGAEVVDAVAQSLAGLPIWCMMESPRGALNALEIADHPSVQGFVLGTNDLAKDLGCETGGDRMPMMTALQRCLMAARAAGILCVDGVYNAFKDDAGLTEECNQGLRLGMDGKSLINPAQVAIANRIFAPTNEQIELAERQIEAFEQAQKRGEGVAVVDGRIVENLHIETARKTLAKAHAIAERAA